MTYLYTLNPDHVERYNFTHLEVNGWFGIYEKKFHKYFDERISAYVQGIELDDMDVELITMNCIEYVEC